MLLNFIEDKLQNVEWFEKNCFSIYYGDKHSLNSMAKETGINRNTLYRAISDVRQYIKNEIKKSKGLGDTIAKVTKATGVEKIVKTFFGDDCGW